MEKKYELKLSHQELLILDGKVNASAQKVIDLAKKENSYGFSIPLLNEVMRVAEERGMLTWTRKNIRSCGLCDKKFAFHKHARSGRYHTKGEPNTKDPVYYSGIEFNQGFVVFAGFGDCCLDCFNAKKMKETIIDFILDNDLKVEIQKNDYKPSRYKKDPIKECFECKQKIQESKMGRLPAMMGGDYPGECPKCGAKSLLFGNSHKSTNEFLMIPAA